MEFTGERYMPCKETENQEIEREHWQRYYFARDFFSDDKELLDIASGEGYGSDFLAQKVKSVIGIDVSEEAIDYARKKYLRNNLEFMLGSIESIPLPNSSLDGIVSFETIEHVEEELHLKFLNETKRVLREDGYLILSCPNKKIASDLAYELWEYKNLFHKKEYYIEELRALLSKYYKNVIFYYQRMETNLILSCEQVEILKTIWSEGKKNDDTQNIIAICSDRAILDMPQSSIMLDTKEIFQNNQKAISDLNKANYELDNRSQWLQQMNAKYINDLEEMRQELEVKKNIITDQSFIIENLNQALGGQKILTEKHQKEINLYVRNIKQQQEDICTFKKQNCEWIEKIIKLESEIATVKNSTCWKLTKPIRYIMDFFRKNLLRC